jgi:hypothetical protein
MYPPGNVTGKHLYDIEPGTVTMFLYPSNKPFPVSSGMLAQLLTELGDNE